jgi:hypothetical protein
MENIEALKRRYIDPLRDHQDQALFFICFLVGAIGIWTLKAAHFSQWFATAFPLSLMGAYVIIAVWTKRYRLREDRVGDNIYYLGFLFTLVSLAYALHVYNPDGSGAADIITNFGIAVFTTIVGLAGRVFFNQMRQDPVEYEREARYSLAEASRELRAQLNDITTELSVFKRRAVQITEEGVTDVAQTAREKMAESVESFGKIANDVIGNIQVAFGTFTDHATKLNTIASHNVDALQALFERIQRIEASPDILSVKFDPIVAKFDEVASESLKRNRAQTADVKRLKDMVEVSLESATALQKRLEMGDELLTKRVSGVSDDLDRLMERVGKFTAVLDEAATTHVVSIDRLKKNSEALTEGIGEQKKSITDLRVALEAELASARRHRDDVLRLTAEGQQALQELNGSLVSIAKAMVGQLRDGQSEFAR